MDYPEPTGSERQVPLEIWRTPSYQAWYAAQRQAGNELHGARGEWVFRVGKGIVFYWALQVDIYIAAEDRHKTNEVVISRPDIAAVVLYRPGADWLDSDIVLVREFRSSARTPDGYIWELPSGSSFHESQADDVTAAHEVDEELGLTIDPQRLRRLESRQLAGTTSAHHAQAFSYALSDAELAALLRQEAAGAAHGNVAETERTCIRVRKVREVIDEPFVDWSTLGMILSAIQRV